MQHFKHSLLSLLPFFAATLVTTACGSAPAPTPTGAANASAGEDEPTGDVSSAVLGGELDNDASSNDAVVALRVGDGSPFELCTGSLIAPNVVMTARHCVSRNITAEIDCDENGTSRTGDQLGDDVSPRTIHVMLGPKPDFGAKPAANGRLIFRPKGKVLCNTDIALVVLDRAIEGVTPLPVRFSTDLSEGELMRAVGYGQNDNNARLGTRFRKDDIAVRGVGPFPRNGSTGRPAVAIGEFEVGKSICQGDSGGPAISETTGAVIGVVSRGVDCELDFGHIYTRTAGFRTLFETTFAEAGGAPIEEKASPALAVTRSNALGANADEADGLGTTITNANAASEPGGCAASGAKAPGLGGTSAMGAALALLLLTLRRSRAVGALPVPVRVSTRRGPRARG